MSHFLKKLRATLTKNFYSVVLHYRHLELLQETYVLNLLSQDRYKDPKRLNRYENQCFSRHGQDGIIGEIFRRIGTGDKTFVEIGAGSGLENNTTYLLTQGWKGFWLEGSKKEIENIRRHFSAPIAQGRLKLQQAFITRENVAQLFQGMEVPVEFDFLSLDIDRNTYYLIEPLMRFKPRVVVVEYNSSYLPGDAWMVEYKADKMWDSTNYYGASLKALEVAMDKWGYHLVGCELTGTDAFFVRKDLTGDLFCQPYTTENHYERHRLFLVRQQGYAASFSDAGG